MLYHDGSLRVSLADYVAPMDTSAEHAAHQHFTNNAQQKGVAGYAARQEATRRNFDALEQLLRRTFPHHPVDPMDDVRCQMQRALASIFLSGAEELTRGATTDDAWSLLGADFTIDQDLRVWITEVQSGPGLPTSTEAARESIVGNDGIMPELVAIIDEVQGAHERGAAPTWRVA